MKSGNRTRKWLILLIAYIVIPCTIVFAQTPSSMPPPPGSGIGDGGDAGTGEDTGVPFDGGISLLVAAGIGYGAKKAHDARKRTITDTDKIL